MNCNICGRKIPDGGKVCPVCNTLGGQSPEVQRRLAEAAGAMLERDFVKATALYHKLADEGVPEAACAYGDILENGVLLLRDLDLAMKYFGIAAKSGSPLGAYRYGRLASRTSSKASDFWICYSAVLGCAASYRTVSEIYEGAGDEQSAAYYCSLAAKDGDADAAVEMVKRYLDGVGVEKDERAAKWYMEQLGMPPLYALKLSYRLRGVSPQKPSELTLTNREKILRSLMADAGKYGLESAELGLAALLAKSGNGEDLYRLAEKLLAGRGLDAPDVDSALGLLSKAADAGCSAAARRLGDIYISGELIPADHDAALTCYRKAAELGEGSSFEILGDLYCEGRIVTADYTVALGYYLDGAKEGHAECKRKADEILTAREDYFSRAMKEEDEGEAFRLFAISAAMGHTPAYVRLANMLELGRGTDKDRRAAFLWYEYALSEGDEEARYHLGRCYAHGIGTAFDHRRATDILAAAKRAGSEAADRELYRLYENKYKAMLRSLYSSAMRLFYQKKFGAARERLEVCRDLGHPAAIYTLGCIYELGLGAPTDRRRAEDLYREAARLGFRDPKMAYKHRILRMGR